MLRTRTGPRPAPRDAGSANPSSSPSGGSTSGWFVNAYCTGPDLVLLRRDERGRLLRQVRRAEYSCFVRKADISEEKVRALRGSKHVVAIREEGDYLRILWRDGEARKNACLKEVRHVDPWTRRAEKKQGLFEQWKIEVFEGDVSPERRWLTDCPGVAIARPRRVYLDFEWDSRVPFTRLAEARILVWALHDDAGWHASGCLAEYAEAAERDLLKLLWRELDRFDQVLAWNGDNADFPLLAARCERLRVAVDLKRWLWLDHLDLFARMNASASESGDEKQSLKLQDVAMSIVGEGKDGFDSSKTWEAWEAGGEERTRLVAYCEQDVALMPRIEAKTGYVDLLQTVCESTFVFPDTFGINPTQHVEGFMMRLAAPRGVKFPTLQPLARKFDGDDDEAPKKKDPFKGAFNLEPREKGILRDVHVCDFSRLYPSVILSWNMSLETHRPDVRVVESENSRPTYLSHLPLKRFPLPAGHCVSPLTDQVFANEPRGVLALALEEMLRLRKEWDARKTAEAPGTEAWKEADRRSAAYKIAANSFYGVIGAPFSRFFVRAIAESVAQGGVWLIKAVIEEAEKRGFRVVYAATDSAFVRACARAEFETFVAWCNDDLFPRMLAEKGCSRNSVKLAYEKQFDRLVLVSRGRYCGRYAHYKGTAATKDSKPEIKGLEYKRGDSTKLARRLQAEVVDMLMDGREEPTEFVAVLERCRDRILKGAIPEELDPSEFVLAKKLGKALREYRVKLKKDGTPAAQPAHVVVGKILAARGRDMSVGVRVEYVVTDATTSPMTVLPFEDFKGAELDRHYLWEDLAYPPTQRLLEAAFPGHDWKPPGRTRPPKPRPLPKAPAAKPGRRAAPRTAAAPKSDAEQGDLFGRG